MVDGNPSPTTLTSFLSPWSFRVCGANTAPTSPSSLSPSTSASFTNREYTQTSNGPAISVPFSWAVTNFGTTCYTGTNSYTLTVASNSALTQNVTTVVQNTNSLSSSASIYLPSGTWYWSVTASNGAVSSSSVASPFTVCVLFPPTSFATINPSNNEVNVNLTNIQFSWGSSTPTAICANQTQIEYTFQLGNKTNGLVTLYSGPATEFTANVTNGTWYWSVTATDSELSVASTPVSSFVTTFSTCSNSTPSSFALGSVSYQYNAPTTTVSLSWSAATLGVSCVNATTPVYVLTVTGPAGFTTLSATIPITTLSYSLPASIAGTYTWSLTVVNSAGLTNSSLSPAGTFQICNLAVVTNFASNFSPPNKYLDTTQSLNTLYWNWTSPQVSVSFSFAVLSNSSTPRTTLLI